MRWLLIATAVVLLAGCSGETGKDKPEKLTPLEGTAVGDFVEGAAGLTQARQGRKASEKIRDIAQQRDSDLEEVYGK